MRPTQGERERTLEEGFCGDARGGIIPAQPMEHRPMTARALTLTSMMLLASCASTQVHTAYRYASNDQATMVAVDIQPGPLPANETFSGSYHSEQIGDVFLEQTGDLVVGQYIYNRASCRATGRIEGHLEGNLLHFNWTESQRACGRIAPLSGKGYMLFWVDSAGNGRTNGEWGMGQSDTGGGPWSLFRDRVRRDPPTDEASTREGPFSGDNATAR